MLKTMTRQKAKSEATKLQQLHFGKLGKIKKIKNFIKDKINKKPEEESSDSESSDEEEDDKEQQLV